MSNLNGRLEKLEARQGSTQRLTWAQIKQIDAADFAQLLRDDPNLAAAWDEILAMQRPSEIAALALDLIRQGEPATDEQRAAIESIKLATGE